MFLLGFRRWFLVFVFSCSATSALAAKSVIGILVFDNVLTSDIIAPAEVFGIASRESWFSEYEVKLINVQKKVNFKTEEGITLISDLSIYDDVVLDVLVVPSAYEMDPFLKNEDLITFIQYHGRKVKWLASNCAGAFLLAESGMLKGHRATTWSGGEKKLKSAYPEINVVFDSNVVVDEPVITSNGSVVSYQAALVLLAKLSTEGRAKEVFEALQLERMIEWRTIKEYL